MKQYRCNQFVVMAFICMAWNTTFAQTGQFSITARNKSLAKVLHKIEKESNFLFFYNPNKINLQKKIDLKIKNVSIQQLLDSLTVGNGLSYFIKDRKIVLTEQLATEREETPNVVFGMIRLDNGKTMYPVSVFLKGTTKGEQADMDGYYSISIPKNIKNPTLVFSVIYCWEVEEVVGYQDFIPVILTERLDLH